MIVRFCAARQTLEISRSAASATRVRAVQLSPEVAGNTSVVDAGIVDVGATTVVEDAKRMSTATGAGTTPAVRTSIARNFLAGAGATTTVRGRVARKFPIAAN